MTEFADKVNWDSIFEKQRDKDIYNPKLSQEFIEEFIDKLNWESSIESNYEFCYSNQSYRKSIC